ncbi:MAG TPA: hypothetical protein PLU22_06345 [Polyangiaceae bacterium]|nr:hypothetical protein [Polyangiaceae bacterium]
MVAACGRIGFEHQDDPRGGAGEAGDAGASALGGFAGSNASRAGAGGAAGSGGVTSSGGDTTAGGDAGASGASPSGGAAGATAAGGATPTGGATAGGLATAGTAGSQASTGGTSTTGGVAGAAGATATGGATAIGGVAGAAGAAGASGATPTGGTMAIGGAAGASGAATSGGTTATGGAAGAAGAGTEGGTDDRCPGVPDPVVPGDWWSTAFVTRIPLTLTEGLAGELPAGYSVALTLDTQALIAAGAMLPSGDDLRVVWVDQGTSRELDRHLVGLDGPSTAVWFATQAPFEAEDTRYALYLGNPAAGPAPARWSDSMGAGAAPSAVYLAADDFEDDAVGALPDGWEGSSAYAVADAGGNRVLEVESFDPDADYLFGGDFTWSDVVVSARLQIQDPAGDYYGLFVRAQPGDDFSALYFGTGSTGRSLQLWDMTIASPTAHAATTDQLRTTTVADLGTSWHTLRAVMGGRDLAFFVDAAPELFSYTVAADRTQGRVGLCVGYADGRAYWDDVIVRRYASPEPVVTAGATESIACP